MACLPISQQKRTRFLNSLRQSSNISQAARAAQINRSSLYHHRKLDPSFARQWDDAEREAVDRLELEAWNRALYGIEKPIVHRGEVTGQYRDYSDKMLEMLLKAHRPEKFKNTSPSSRYDPDDDPGNLYTESSIHPESQESASQKLAAILDSMASALDSSAHQPEQHTVLEAQKIDS